MNKTKSNKWMNFCLSSLLIGIITLMASVTIADPDLWGHTRFGTDITTSRNIIQRDQYSYLSSTWINHEWLSEVILGNAANIFGVPGLVILKVIITVCVFGIGFRYLANRGGNVLRSGLLLILSVKIAQTGIITIRPQTFTHLLFIITLIILYLSNFRNTRWLWVLPFTFAAWANLHGGFLAGLSVVLLWSGATLIINLIGLPGKKFSKKELLNISAATGVTILAPLANPYGTDLILFLLRTGTVPRPEIAEWNPLVLMSIDGIAYLIGLGLSIIGLIFSRQKREPALILVFVALVILPLQAVRHLTLFALGFLIIAGPHILSAWERLRGEEKKRKEQIQPKRAQKLTMSAVLIMTIFIFGLSATRWNCIPFSQKREPRQPVFAVELLKNAKVAGNLATHFAWGEYILWHLGPQIKVSIDGRRETVYSDEIYQENLNFMFGTNQWDAILDKHPTDMALMYTGSATANLLSLKPGWELVYKDGLSSLFARKDTALANTLRVAGLSQEANMNAEFCFP